MFFAAAGAGWGFFHQLFLPPLAIRLLSQELARHLMQSCGTARKAAMVLQAWHG